MGVRGLSTFIDNNQKLLIHHRLHNTKVVIDGNNLYHFLYYKYHVAHEYGGDYDHYARKCKRFFSLLQKCGVEPVIVFDGGYDPDDRKLTTILSRMRDRRSAADAICTSGHGKVMPILAAETFRLVLVELNIPHISCDFEADDEIAVLANDLNCPVLSNDSDFFVYDLKAGYIPLDYINLTLCVHDKETAEDCVCTLDKQLTQSEYRYLPVKIYCRAKLSNFFKNKNEYVIPLFATLLGNDYMDNSDLAQFYSKLQLPRNITKFFFSPKTQSRLAALIQWLNENEESDLTALLDFVIGQIKTEKQDDLQSEIYKSVQSYSRTNQYTGINLMLLLDKSTDEKHISAKCELSVSDYYGNKLPDWFVSKLRRWEINPLLQNVAILHRVILICQVEIMAEPSTYQCSQSIREVMYKVILQHDTNSLSMDGAFVSGCSTIQESESYFVMEFDRDQKNTKKVNITPAKEILHFGTLPNLAAVPKLPVEERQLLLTSTLGLSKEDVILCKDLGLDGGIVLLLSVISYWINHAKPCVTSAHLDTLIMSVVVLHVKVLLWIQQRRLLSLDYVEPDLYPLIAQTFNNSSEKQILRLVKNVDKYFVKPEHTAKRPRNNTIVHGFSQFQSCLRDLIYLNQLLLCPFSSPNPSFIINGTFMYNFCRDVTSRPDQASFLSEMLDRHSPMCQLFSLLRKQAHHLIDKDCFAENKTVRKKKSKQKKNAQKTAEKSVEDGCVGDLEKEKKSKLETTVNCSVNNRFALLDLDD